MNVFRDLLRIKSFREDQAELRMLRQRDLTRQAQQKHEEESSLLRRMLREGQEAEQRLYGGLCKRVVHLRDIEDVQQTVASFRRRESLQEDAVQTARDLESKAQEALTASRIAHQEAHRQKSKFLDISRDFDLASAREAERKEDLELEETASLTRDREDWESQDLNEGQA